MVLYLTTILISMIIICIFNIVLGTETFNNYEVWVVWAVTLSVVVEIAISGFFSYVCEKFPEKCYSPYKKFFTVSKKEQKFYEKLGIKKWKDKVWELGQFTGFRKNKIADPSSSAYLYQFLIQSNRGMLGHIINLFAGFLVIFILPLKYVLRIGLPVAIVGFVLNLLPVMILRYNIPKLMVAYRRASRLEERRLNKTIKNTTSDEVLEEKVLNT